MYTYLPATFERPLTVHSIPFNVPLISDNFPDEIYNRRITIANNTRCYTQDMYANTNPAILEMDTKTTTKIVDQP